MSCRLSRYLTVLAQRDLQSLTPEPKAINSPRCVNPEGIIRSMACRPGRATRVSAMYQRVSARGGGNIKPDTQ
jgi:hypothetical protein